MEVQGHENGIVDEMKTIDCGDKRLDRRAGRVIEQLASDPQVSVNAASQGWNETIGAYRFFDNDKVDLKTILKPHRDATIERAQEHEVVLIAQDTSELDFTGHPPQGSGPLNYEFQRGFLDHTHMAMTPQQLVLGVVGADIYARDDEGHGQRLKRKYDPIETKESYRWVQGYHLACEIQQQSADTQIVSVADREGDLYEIYVAAQEHETPADYIIRAKQQRCLPEKDPTATGNTYLKMQDEIEQSEVLFIREVDLQSTPKRTARIARLEVRAQTLTIKPPQVKRDLPEVELNVVLVREIDPPDDGTAIEWLLITSLPIEESADILTVIDYYAARWAIEVFFRILKSGCKVEEIQLETDARLLPCLMVYKVIAWRVQYLTMLGRECPELPCDVVFASHEWKAVYRVVTQDPLPETPPDLGAFLLMVGELGGHNNRKHDGPPGPQSLWIGLRRTIDFATAWLSFGPENH